MARPTDQQMLDRLRAINADERYHYPAATLFENGPLALIQLEMETEARVLAWALDVPCPRPIRTKSKNRKKPA